MNTSKAKLSIAYLWAHLALMVAVLMFWLPVYFICYGGGQAVILLCLLHRPAFNESSVFKQKSIYFFSLMECVYTLALVFVGALGYFDQSLACLRGTEFNNPEFFPLYYSIPANVLYFTAVLGWGAFM